MKNRSTQDPFPEEVTNRPRDLRLIAMSGAVRQARHEPSPTWLLVLSADGQYRLTHTATGVSSGWMPREYLTIQWGVEHAANANLIAAAPDLYVALEDLADIIETLCKWLDVAHGLAGGAIEGAYREACAGSLRRAATALAKARGEEVAR